MGSHGDTVASVQSHAPLSVIGGLFQCASISWCKSSCPLSGVKRCPLFRGSVYVSYIGGSAGAWAIRMSVRRRWPLCGVSVIRGSTVLCKTVGAYGKPSVTKLKMYVHTY